MTLEEIITTGKNPQGADWTFVEIHFSDSPPLFTHSKGVKDESGVLHLEVNGAPHPLFPQDKAKVVSSSYSFTAEKIVRVVTYTESKLIKV